MTINQLLNTASVIFNEESISSNTVTTNLLLAPVLTKSVDKSSAYIGDTLTYTVLIENMSLAEITSLQFTDVLPDGSEYVADSFTLNSASATPVLTGNTLTFTVDTLTASGSVTLSYQVLVTG